MKDALRVPGNLFVCPTPLALDTYDGCSAGCAYCFARIAARSSVKSKTDRFEAVEPRRLSLAALRGEGSSAEAAMVRHGIPVHMGGLSDPFQPIERQMRATLVALEAIRDAGRAVVVSTKFGLLAEDPWRSVWEAIGQRLLQVSLIACDDTLEALEPGALPWRERLALVREVSSTTPVVVRIQPFIRTLSADALQRTCDLVAEAGGRGIIVEGLKVPRLGRGEVMTALSRSLGRRFEAPTDASGPDAAYHPAVQFAYQLAARRAARRAGLAHNAADNAMRWLGDSYACCGTDLIAGRVGVWEANWGHATAVAIRDGEVGFDTIDRALGPQGNARAGRYGVNEQNAVARARVAAAYGNGQATLRALYRYRWNLVRQAGGVADSVPSLAAARSDPSGDVVYRFGITDSMVEAIHRATGEDWTAKTKPPTEGTVSSDA